MDSAQISDGGPAFPTRKVMSLGGGACRTELSGGMTLRDYFAAHAMQALIASETDRKSLVEADLWAPSSAYEIADAMLAARAKP